MLLADYRQLIAVATPISVRACMCERERESQQENFSTEQLPFFAMLVDSCNKIYYLKRSRQTHYTLQREDKDNVGQVMLFYLLLQVTTSHLLIIIIKKRKKKKACIKKASNNVSITEMKEFHFILSYVHINSFTYSLIDSLIHSLFDSFILD